MAKVPRRGAVLSLSALFRLSSDFSPAGDQPRAIGRLIELLAEGRPHSVLLGITGSGKTFTLANVIAGLGRPALVISPNKTLAAQLYGEFKSFFPTGAVEYFVSYYDYYQPEAYIPQSDTYIEKDALVNDEIDRMRHSATTSPRTRNLPRSKLTSLRSYWMSTNLSRVSSRSMRSPTWRRTIILR